MPRAEAVEHGRRREDPGNVRFVWTTAGRVRRLTVPAPGERPKPVSRILESLSRFEPAPRPLSLLFK
jgi:hypothetical protein